MKTTKSSVVCWTSSARPTGVSTCATCVIVPLTAIIIIIIILSLFSRLVIKSGAINVRASQLRVKKYKVIYGTLNYTAPLSVAVNETTTSNAIADSGIAGTAAASKRKQKFVIVGVGNGRDESSPLTARTVLNWHSATTQLKRALKKAKSGDVCTRRNRSAAGRPGRRQKKSRNRKGTTGA